MPVDRTSIYIVDGNNVMGQRVGWHRDRPGARRRLVAELGGLGRSEGVGILVVFDGPGTEGELGFGSNATPAPPGAGVVYAVFAGRQTDADSRIVDIARHWAEESDSGTGITAVTSDRELSRRLAEVGIESIRSGAFRRLLGDRA